MATFGAKQNFAGSVEPPRENVRPPTLSLFPSVSCQHLTVDEPSQVGCKEHHRIGDVLRGAQALHRDPLLQRLLSVLPVPGPLPFGCRIGTDEPRRDTVDGDAERTKLVRELPG